MDVCCCGGVVCGECVCVWGVLCEVKFDVFGDGEGMVGGGDVCGVWCVGGVGVGGVDCGVDCVLGGGVEVDVEVEVEVLRRRGRATRTAANVGRV